MKCSEISGILGGLRRITRSVSRRQPSVESVAGENAATIARSRAQMAAGVTQTLSPVPSNLLSLASRSRTPASSADCGNHGGQLRHAGLRAVKIGLVRCDSLSERLGSVGTAANVGLARNNHAAAPVLRSVQIVLDRCDRVTGANASDVNRNPPRVPNAIQAPRVTANTTEFRVLQLNMRRSTVVTGEVRELVKEKKLDILLLQEPYVRKQDQSHTFYGLGTGMKVAAVRSARPWAAVALCNPNFQMIFISQLSTTHCVCAEVQAPGCSIYVVSYYFQWSDDIEQHLRHLEMVLRSLMGKRILIALDANARSSLWGPQTTNSRGEKLEELIRAFGLHVANDASQPPTYWTTRGSSYIDVTLGSASMARFIREWRVQEDWTSSDHNALVITLRVPKATGNDQSLGPTRFNIKKANWERFSEILTDQSRSRLEVLELEAREDVDRMAESLTSVIIEACEGSMPRKKRFRKSNPWWTEQLTKLKKAAYRKRREYKNEPRDSLDRPRLKLEYQDSLRIYSRGVKVAKRASWRRFVTSNGNQEPWGLVYKLQADKLQVEKVLSTIRCEEGFTMDMSKTASCLLQTHIPDDIVEDDTPEQREVRNGARCVLDTPDAPVFTKADLAKAFRTLKNGKAPGPDFVEVEVLKQAFATIPDQLVRLFNGCLQWGVFPSAWKEGSLRILLKGEGKDEKDPKSYRPICLLPVVGKIFEKLLKARLSLTAMAPGQISDRQFGFTPEKSAEDAIVEMRRMVNRCEDAYAVALLFDISGAFDNVWWPLVLDGLRKRECPKNIFEVMKDYFDDRKVKIVLGNEEVSKQATRGCPQGSVLGPVCWNLMFDELLRKLEDIVPENFVAYADDLLVLLTGDSRRELEEKGQIIVDAILDWCTSAKLQLSERKTEAIVLKSKGKARRGEGNRPDRRARPARMPDLARRPPRIRIGNSVIAFKKNVRYLGVYFDEKLKVNTHCDYLREKVNKLFEKLRRLAGSGWGLRFRALSTVYRGVFLPTITYASAGWSDLCTEKDKKVLSATQRRALLATTSAWRTASGESLAVIAGAVPVCFLLEERRARYEIRIGRDTVINGKTIRGNDEGAVERIKGEVVKMWNRQWQSSPIGYNTFCFFRNIQDRLEAGWFRPNRCVVQVITGHGVFRAFLASRRIIEDGENCATCGTPDTVEHFLLECRSFEPQRVALREIIGNETWPRAASAMVATKEAFAVFSEYCKDTVWIREQERLIGQGVEVEEVNEDE